MKRHREPHSNEPPKKKVVPSHLQPKFNLKPGQILTDLTGKLWKLGRTIGVGGFGEIFHASDNLKEDVDASTKYVAKVECHTNGPLFVEINCYLRIAKLDLIKHWKKENKLDHLGMPHYVASGSHIAKGVKYRFLIIPFFEKDLEKVFESKHNRFSLKTILTVALQITDTLQYIHSKGYVHSDIKASNILLGNQVKPKPSPSSFVRYYGCTPFRSCKSGKLMPHNLRLNKNLRCVQTTAPKSAEQIYLLDYGLATKYRLANGEHKKFSTDERKAHAGTLLFCSRDAHKGAQSARSDLECLGYNLIYWLTSSLPWIDDSDAEVIHRKKQHGFHYLGAFLKNCFGQFPQFLYDYFNYIANLEFDEKPNYKFCKNLFTNALIKNGFKDNSNLDFDNQEKGLKTFKSNLENRKPKIALNVNRMPLVSRLPTKHILRKRGVNKALKQNHWSKILMDPEFIMKKSRERKSTETNETNHSILNLNLIQLKPTSTMIEVYNKGIDRLNATRGVSPFYRGDSAQESIDGYTPAMNLILSNARDKRWIVKNSLGPIKTGSKAKLLKQKWSEKAVSTRPTRKSVKKTPKAKVVPIRKTYSLRG